MSNESEPLITDDDSVEERQSYTPEEVEEMLKIANIKSSDIAPIVQILYTSISLERQTDEYKILEVDDHLLQTLEGGECISFRGDDKEPAVLCTPTRTYEVKEAEISNTCLLIPNLKSSEEVMIEDQKERIIENVNIEAVFNTYLEVRECSPRLSKLLTILEPSSFRGLEYEKLIDQSTLYDWNRLRSRIQASDGEILNVLPEYLIANMDGYYRLIAFEFEARALPLMLDLIEENSWEMDEIDKDVSYESLKEIIPKPVFELLFQKYTTPSEKIKEDNTQLYKYNIEKASKLLAKILLLACPTNDYDDFMEAWKMGSPDNMQPKEEYLYGIAIIKHQNQRKKEVIFYPESNLPDNIHERLSELFKAKIKWTVPEITPYISKFATHKQDVNAILTKFARSSTINGIKYYSSKHEK